MWVHARNELENPAVRGVVFGGDEFAIILPGADLDAARALTGQAVASRSTITAINNCFWP
jgi:GGDEF domain-containing protein